MAKTGHHTEVGRLQKKLPLNSCVGEMSHNCYVTESRASLGVGCGHFHRHGQEPGVTVATPSCFVVQLFVGYSRTLCKCDICFIQ